MREGRDHNIPDEQMGRDGHGSKRNYNYHSSSRAHHNGRYDNTSQLRGGEGHRVPSNDARNARVISGLSEKELNEAIQDKNGKFLPPYCYYRKEEISKLLT